MIECCVYIRDEVGQIVGEYTVRVKDLGALIRTIGKQVPDVLRALKETGEEVQDAVEDLFE